MEPLHFDKAQVTYQTTFSLNKQKLFKTLKPNFSCCPAHNFSGGLHSPSPASLYTYCCKNLSRSNCMDSGSSYMYSVESIGHVQELEVRNYFQEISYCARLDIFPLPFTPVSDSQHNAQANVSFE